MIMAALTLLGWTATVAVVLALTLYGILRNFNSWLFVPRLQPGQAPLPPGDLGWPVIGNFIPFLKAWKSQTPDSWIAGIVKTYGRNRGAYATFLFGQPTVLSISAEVSKKVLMDGEIFSSGWPETARQLLGRKSFAVIQGVEHERLRRLTQAKVQGQDHLKNSVARIEELAKKKLDAWARQRQFKLVDGCREFTFESILKVLVDFPFEGHQMRTLLGCLRKIGDGVRAFRINFPGTAYHSALKARKILVRELQSLIDDRKERKTAQREDVLQSLLDLVDENNVHLTDEEVIDVIGMFMLAGHVTSTVILMWAMIFLQANPQALNEARAEQIAIQRVKEPGEHLTFADFKKMTYLDHVLDETLRIVNVAPIYFRKVETTTTLAGFTIPQGWFVEVLPRPIHLDKDIYPEPYAFRPERWKTFVPKLGEFIPFALGPRSCIGNEFAKMELSIFLHHAILNYKCKQLHPNGPLNYLPYPIPKDGGLCNFYHLSAKQ